MDAYVGDQPYIFVSYAHKDSSIVVPIIDKMQCEGYRIWYDKGIEAGTEWPQYIAEHLANASCVLVFMSSFSAESHNCRNEINLASELKKEMLVVYLQDFELSLGLRLQLNLSQALYKNRFKKDSEFFNELMKAKIIQPYNANISHEGRKIQETSKDEKPNKKTKTIIQKLYETRILFCVLISVLVVIALGCFVLFMNNSKIENKEQIENPVVQKDSTKLITDYNTFYKCLVETSKTLECDSLWNLSALTENLQIEQDDGDTWTTYYTDAIALEDVSMHLGFANGGEEIMVILNNVKEKDINVAYKLLECVSSGVGGYYFTDFIDVLTNDDRVPWRNLEVEAHSIWNEVLQLDEPAYSMVDLETKMKTDSKTMNIDNRILIYVEKRSRVYNGDVYLDFTVLYDNK